MNLNMPSFQSADDPDAETRPDALDSRTQELFARAEAHAFASQGPVELAESMVRLSLAKLAAYAERHTSFKYTPLGFADDIDDALLHVRIEASVLRH
ncbi:MAG: hypothetical protein EOO24_19485 [Comamonadaceae bacterium]|nr:MAG: hypothetical protein EOO24_19485 [Comamonadaceae bacterium]